MLLLFALALAALPAHAAAAPTLQVATKAEWATGSSVDISWTPVHHATNSTVFLVQASSSTTALNATSTIQIGRSTIGTLQYSVSECVQNGADYYVVVNDENGARGVSSRVTVLAALPKVLYPGVAVNHTIQSNCQAQFLLGLSTPHSGHLVLSVRGHTPECLPKKAGCISPHMLVRQGAVPVGDKYDQQLKLGHKTAGGGAFLVLPFANPDDLELYITVLLGDSRAWDFTIEGRVQYECPEECSSRGQCLDGDCLCEPGFEGAACETEQGGMFAPPPRPLVLVPDMAGSRLTADGCALRSDGTNRHTVWVDAPPEVLGTGDGVVLEYDPDSGLVKTLPYEDRARQFLFVSPPEGQHGTVQSHACPGSVVQAPDQNFGLDSISGLLSHEQMSKIDALEATEGMPAQADFHRLQYMKNLLHDLKRLGYKPGESLFGFPYDWRQSLKHPPTLARLDALLEKAVAASTGGQLSKIDLVSHGSGGLLVLSWLRANPEQAKRHVASWTAIATPWRGSPSMAEQLLFGGSWGNPYLSRKTGRAIASNLPSVYEQLPQHGWTGWTGAEAPNVIIGGAVQVPTETGAETVTIDATSGEHARRVFNMAHDLPAVMKPALKSQSSPVIRDTDKETTRQPGKAGTMTEDYGGQMYPCPWQSTLYKAALAVQKVWKMPRELPAGIDTAVVAGTGRDTMQSLVYSAATELAILNLKPGSEWADGDGTVLLKSATSTPFKPNLVLHVPADHLKILEHHKTLSVIRDRVGLQCPWHGVWRWDSAVVSLFQSDMVVHAKLAGSAIFVAHARLGELEGRIIADSHHCVSFTMHPSCLLATGSFQTCPGELLDQALKHPRKALQSSAQNITLHRMFGPECRRGDFMECSTPHGSGQQLCTFGWWGAECLISKCDKGYCPAIRNDTLQCAACDEKSSKQVARKELPLCPKAAPFWCHNHAKCASTLQKCGDKDNAENLLCPVEKQLRCHGGCHSDASACFAQSKAHSGRTGIEPCGTVGHGEFVCASGNCSATREACESTPAQIIPCQHKSMIYCSKTRQCVRKLEDCYLGLGKCIHSGCTADQPSCSPRWKHCMPKHGAAAAEHQASNNRCPKDTPIECSDGTCAKEHCSSDAGVKNKRDAKPLVAVAAMSISGKAGLDQQVVDIVFLISCCVLLVAIVLVQVVQMLQHDGNLGEQSKWAPKDDL